MVWKDDGGSWQVVTQAGQATRAELEAMDFSAMKAAGSPTRTSLEGSQLDLEGLTANSEPMAGCVVPGTTELVPVGSSACIGGTIQVCQSNGSFRDMGDPC